MSFTPIMDSLPRIYMVTASICTIATQAVAIVNPTLQRTKRSEPGWSRCPTSRSTTNVWMTCWMSHVKTWVWERTNRAGLLLRTSQNMKYLHLRRLWPTCRRETSRGRLRRRVSMRRAPAPTPSSRLAYSWLRRTCKPVATSTPAVKSTWLTSPAPRGSARLRARGCASEKDPISTRACLLYQELFRCWVWNSTTMRTTWQKEAC